MKCFSRFPRSPFYIFLFQEFLDIYQEQLAKNLDTLATDKSTPEWFDRHSADLATVERRSVSPMFVSKDSSPSGSSSSSNRSSTASSNSSGYLVGSCWHAIIYIPLFLKPSETTTIKMVTVAGGICTGLRWNRSRV